MKPSSHIRLFETCCLLWAALLSSAVASGQVHGGPVRQGDSGPVSQGSRDVRSGSGPVYEPGISVGQSGSPPISGSSVRESATADVRSGPVEDFSSGPVTSGQTVAGSGAVSDTKTYTFTHDVESLIGPGVPAHSLSHLQEQIRAIQPLPPEGAATEEEAAAQPPAAEEAPAGEPVTEPTPEEEITPEEPSEPEPTAETSEPEAAAPTPGEEASGETEPEAEPGEAAEPAAELTPTPQP